MPAWRIYYDDGSTFDSDRGTWEAAPAQGVICVVTRDPTGQWGRHVFSGWSAREGQPGNHDFFVKHRDNDEPFSTADLGPFLAKPGNSEASVKYGRMTGQANWEAIMNRAAADPDFPKGTPRRRASDWR
jgi:hypothetical protein